MISLQIFNYIIPIAILILIADAMRQEGISFIILLLGWIVMLWTTLMTFSITLSFLTSPPNLLYITLYPFAILGLSLMFYLGSVFTTFTYGCFGEGIYNNIRIPVFGTIVDESLFKIEGKDDE